MNSLRNKSHVTYVENLISSVDLSAVGVCETWLTVEWTLHRSMLTWLDLIKKTHNICLEKILWVQL